MDDWQRLLRESVHNLDDLKERFGDVFPAGVEEVIKRFKVRITPQFLKLIEKPGDAMWLQVVPDVRELEEEDGEEDPLAEDQMMPVPGLTHRYPDRVLLLVNHQCPVYCRFCTRKRKVSKAGVITRETVKAGIDYIRKHPEIRDVVVSGGDPFMLPDDRLDEILGELRSIPHVEIFRIGTRVPTALPQRITPELCTMLRKHHPVYINVHFDHPREVNAESEEACNRLADAGCVLGNQMVLLRGVNDDPAVVRELNKKLLKMRVRPYYIYQADLVQGTGYLRTRLEVGLDVIRGLRGFMSGLGVPHFVIDAPGGGGKIPLLPNYVVNQGDREVLLRNFRGELYAYVQPDGDGTAPPKVAARAGEPSNGW
jgi:lysine 2,3-aminomutase